MRYPNTKAQIHALQYQQQSERLQKSQAKRTSLENWLTHFDECGAVIFSKEAKWLEAFRAHQWKHLFWENRSIFDEKIKIVIFGHGVLEKCLNPYIGLTAKAWLVHDWPDNIDDFLSSNLKNIAGNVRLAPLPVLGVPGWDPRNQRADFYDNQDYFRPKT